MLMQKGKILVVDDEPDIVDVLKEFLNKKGYDIISANNAQQAFEALDSQKADLVLLDIMMPGMKGTEAARIIKQKYPRIKIAILTGYPDMGDKLIKERVLDGIFTKPVRMRELTDSLIRILGLREESNSVEDKLMNKKSGPFIITARLFFIEHSFEIYNSIKEKFQRLSKKGQHYLIEVACNATHIEQKLSFFKPDILLVNASYFKKQDKDIISQIISENYKFKEILVYNTKDELTIDEKTLSLMIKNVELTCFLRGLL